MKKKVLMITAMLLFVVCSILFVSCGSEEVPQPTKLSAPQVVLNGDTASWSAELSADRFEISLNGELSYVESSMTSKRLKEGQSFKIRAIGDGVNYLTSDWSNTVVYTAAQEEQTFTVTWKNGDNVLEIDVGVVRGAIPSYNSAEPTKKADDRYTYTFAGWEPELVAVTEDVTYTARFDAVPKSYTVTFYDENGMSVLASVSVFYGETAVYPGTVPTKDASDGYTYVFEKWVTQKNGSEVDTLTDVVADRSVYASYKATLKTVSVRVVSSNSEYGAVSETVLHDVPYGSPISINGQSIVVNGQTITAEAHNATAQYTYAFVGWTSEGVVGSNTVITANFSCVVNNYTVTWKNGTTLLEMDLNVPYGSIPVYDGSLPEKPATAQYTYRFKGWSPEISAVSGDVTYIALFEEVLNTYTVTFYDEDGVTVLDVVTVDYGSDAAYSKSAPTKSATEQYTFCFNKWVTSPGGAVEDDLTSVVADRAVYATYTATIKTMTVHIVVGNSEYGTVSTSVLYGVPYGTTIDVNGQTISVNGQVVTATPTSSDAQYTYSFTGWTAVDTVTEDTVVVANFSCVINSYTITWKNGDTTLEIDLNVPYGTTPTYNGAMPTKPEDANVYTFSGWSPAISGVTGDATYVAQFTSEENIHVVTFYDEDGATVLGVAVVKHGETAAYPNALPTKQSTPAQVFTFDK